MPTHLCAAGMAFMGFSISLFIGLWADNTFATVVMRSLVVLALFYLLGYVLSAVGQKVIMENFDAESQAIRNELQIDSTQGSKDDESNTSSNPLPEDVQSHQMKG
ncbi:MAG: hypothetical protein IID28_11605 [Planctomycetes bacterium]|nr:hypothetical protein [Planctomycetota bacterium]